jgi:hypothetical protein
MVSDGWGGFSLGFSDLESVAVQWSCSVCFP